MRITVLSLLCTALLCFGECVKVEPQEFGLLKFEAFSVLGERLSNISVDLVEVGSKQSFRSHVNGSTVGMIPFGLYEARVWAPGFRTARREVRVNDRDVLVRVQLAVSIECDALHELAGVVRPSPADLNFWVKLVPLRGVGGSEVPVSRDGSFRLTGLDAGQYLLLVVDGKEVVHTATTTVPSATRIDVVLTRNQ